MKKNILFLLIVFSAIFFSGCAVYTRTLNDAEAAKGAGVTRYYNKKYDLVWKAINESVAESGLMITTTSRPNGKILAIGKQTAFSFGEFVAIYVEDIDGRSNTKVEIISLAKKSNNLSATNWAEKLFEDLDRRIN